MARSASKVSQSQLARELGISQALVSHVLNGKRQGINAATYERIWAHAVQRGYCPKGMDLGASPVAQRHQVGIILRAGLSLKTPSMYFSHLQHGLHRGIEAAGYTTVFLGAEDQIEEEKLRRVFAPGHAFHGLVLVGEVQRRLVDELRHRRVRLVSVSARQAGLCHSVLGNEPQALEALVGHLHRIGHRRFGWLGGNISLGRHEARLHALTSALARHHLRLDTRYMTSCTDAGRIDGADSVRSMLPFAERADFPTAFITYNTLMAAGAVREFNRAGWTIPDDVSVASSDFSTLAKENTPRITSAGSCPERLGEAAAKLVLEPVATQPETFTDLTLPAQLFIGETTGQPRGTVSLSTLAAVALRSETEPLEFPL